MNAADIKSNPAALAAASTGDWSACAAAMQAVSVTAAARACFGAETAEVLNAAGGRRHAIMAAMLTDPDGVFVMEKLAGPFGVVWAHPMTVGLIDSLVASGIATAADKAALVQLSQPTTFPFAGVTADQCRVAFETDALSSEWSAILNDGGVNVALSTGDRDGLDNSIILYVASHGIESLKSAMIVAHQSDYLSDETKAALAAAIEVL